MEPLAAGDPRQTGPYRLRSRLGAGGMGRVFLGFSPAGRAVAVKVVHPQLAADPAFRVRFAREVAAARAVSGAYTAPVLAAGTDDDPPWLATLFVAGPSLAEAVTAAGPLPAVPAWRLAAGLAEALAEIHGRGLVHRDLKPANVLLAIDGPRVIDFGISRAREATVMTMTGLVVGTPSFMSPEQASGGLVGPASDVFSLGGLIVFATAGTAPFGDGPAPSLLYRVVHAEPALDAVPGGLRELAAACLAKDPAARPPLPQLIAAITAGSPPGAASLGSFWPGTVSGLIRSHQARLDAQLASSGTEEDPGPAPVTEPEPATEPGPATETAARLRPDEPTATGPSGPAPAAPPYQGAASAPAVLAVAAPAPGLPADPARGGDRALGHGHPEPSGPAGRAGGHLTRRRALAGLAGAAAGLAAAGWELSRGTAPLRPGTEIWSTGAGGGPYARPAIGHGVVYVPGSTDDGHAPGGPLVAVRASDGATIWSSRLGRGVTSLPAPAGDVIYFDGMDNRLYAVRASNGTKIWATGLGGGPATSPVTARGVIYFGGNDNQLYAVRASNGTKIWATGLGGGPATYAAAAASVVYFGGNDNQLYAVRT